MSSESQPGPEPVAESDRLRRELARTAGRIAETEDQVAATRRQLAEQKSERAGELLEGARHAEKFAASERAERRRLDPPGDE